MHVKSIVAMHVKYWSQVKTRQAEATSNPVSIIDLDEKFEEANGRPRVGRPIDWAQNVLFPISHKCTENPYYTC